MKTVIAVLLMLLFLVPGAANAQATPTCSAADLSPSFPDMLQALGDAQAQLSGGDVAAVLTSLDLLKGQIEVARAKCAGLSFEGDGNQVVGPFDLPKGVYRVHGEFAGFAIVTLEQISGDCGLAYGDSSPILNTPTASGGVTEAILRPAACRAALQLSTMGGKWSISFEAIN